MTYPTSNPAAKHDLLCSNSIIDAIHQPTTSNIESLETMDALSSSIIQSRIPSKDALVRLTTIYTYPDAPKKPLSRSPRIWRLVKRSVFDAATNNIASSTDNNGNGGGDSCLLKHCTIAVKLPANIPPGDEKAHKYTKFFQKFMHYLHSHQLAAVLACDSQGRIGFIAPVDGNEEYAAYLYYAPMKEFLPWSKANHANSLKPTTSNSQEEELATWTPQYAPPPEEECQPRGWDDVSAAGTSNEPEPATWTPQYDPPPEEECGPRGWENQRNQNNNNGFGNDDDGPTFVMEDDDDDAGPKFVPDNDDGAGLFVPPGASDGDTGGFGNNDQDGDGDGLFVPTTNNDDDGGGFGNNEGLWGSESNGFGDTGGFGNGGFDNTAGAADTSGGWDTSNAWDATNNNTDICTEVNKNADTNEDTGIGGWTKAAPDMNEGTFHANTGAAAADAFYSGLTRSLNTRADSRLYHMRSFNGWVKATQIAELDPDTSRAPVAKGGKKRSRNSPMRVLDLACGKGGDLGKWTLHQRKLENYVGSDVARGSLVDAAIRARQMSKRNKSVLKRCTFSLADLGEDVPGRKRSKRARRMQKLLTWNLETESSEAKESDPVFVTQEGGGISEQDKFDVVSIQFAIHYMMQTRKRARRFFHTVSSLLEIGGNLIATTIDARVVVEKLMGLGKDYHFDDNDMHEEVDGTTDTETVASSSREDNNARRKLNESQGATVTVGKGVCRLKFDADMLQKIFQPPKTPEDMFGLQYTFTLSEGEDHAAGVGEAVDLPEWLTPIPALEELAEESGLKLEYATNFHEFYKERKNPASNPMAHNALYNMKVLNRKGSISEQEWEVSRMYIAVKFRKVRESTLDLGDDDVGEDEMKE